jgi:hypothetical protein
MRHCAASLRNTASPSLCIRKRRNRTPLSQRLRNEDGAVSVYLLLILVALFLFHMLFIDIVRHRLASSAAETAARSAGRSVLSGFQPSLLDYGVFGTDASESDVEAIMERTLAKPLLPRERLAIYETSIRENQVTVESLYHLGDHEVFRRQVLEKMKYMAGIEFTREVMQKIGKGKKTMEEAQQFAKLTKRMEALLNERDELLDQAWETSRNLVQSALVTSGMSEIDPAQIRYSQYQSDQLAKYLQSALEANEKIRDELRAANIGGTYSGGGDGENDSTDDIMPPIMVLPSDYFAEYLSDAGVVVSMLGAVARTMESNDEEKLMSARERLQNYASEWLEKKAKEEEQRQDEIRQIRKKQADERKKIDEELKTAGLFPAGCGQPDDPQRDAIRQAYNKLESPGGYYQKYKTYNMHDTIGGMSKLNTDDAESFALESLGMLGEITKLAESARDEVFVNEYALTFFTYRTWDSPGSQTKSQPSIGNRQAHVLSDQEAEYVLYGLPDCSLNLGAAHAEIFALRLAMRTAEELAKPKKAVLGHPVLVLLSAMAEGAKKANEDTTKLLKGESVEFPFLSGAAMNYKDHLRLFYLLHSDDASVLSRMQALIELNTTLDLMKQYSAVRVKVIARPNLWFMNALPPISAEAVTSY